jgi:Flp pilus assembly protein TadG
MKRFLILRTQPSRPVDCPRQRRGVVAVEFAIVAPVLLAVVLGMMELTRMIEAQNDLEIAAREGARFACMDHEGLLQSGQTANQKLVDDVKNYLASNGMPREEITVEVMDHENPGTTFDLADPNNNLKLFDVNVKVNYSAVRYSTINLHANYMLNGSVTFRNGIATVAE